LVNVSFPVGEFVYQAAMNQGGDYCYRQVLEYLRTNQALPVDPFHTLEMGSPTNVLERCMDQKLSGWV
jgi:hypothetical protein